MTKLTKTLLGLAVTGIGSGLLFVTGAITVQENVFWYVTLPAGAIFFGLFLISLALQKATAQFDEDARVALARVSKQDCERSAKEGTCVCSNSASPAIATAH
jgi:hypothetical protein